MKQTNKQYFKIIVSIEFGTWGLSDWENHLNFKLIKSWTSVYLTANNWLYAIVKLSFVHIYINIIILNTAVCSTTHKHRLTSLEWFYMNTANVPIKSHSQAIMHHWGNSSQPPQVQSASMRPTSSPQGYTCPNNEQHYAETSKRLIKESSAFYTCQSCYGFAYEHNMLIGF